MSVAPSTKKELIDKHGIHSGDTGSSGVQIALLTEQINQLAGHVKGHPKDAASRRSLTLMVSRRQRHLEYLKRTKPESYLQVINKLGLRK